MTKKTSREKIIEHCEIKRVNKRSETIVYGNRELRMNRFFENVPDSDLDKALADKDLGIGAYISQREKSGEEKKEKRAAAVANLESKPCECGCKEMTRRGSRFKPGHDAKLKSALMKAAAKGDTKAQEELLSRGWVRVAT